MRARKRGLGGDELYHPHTLLHTHTHTVDPFPDLVVELFGGARASLSHSGPVDTNVGIPVVADLARASRP